MTISIHIEAHPDRGDMKGQIDQAMTALGFRRVGVHISAEAASKLRPSEDEVTSGMLISSDETVNITDTGAVADEVLGTNIAGTAAPARKRGEPSPGKSRRTKAEIAEDDAADKADAARQEAAVDANIQAEGADEVKAAISTGENRVGPDDEQDEAAEVEANRKGLTHDDLRQAVGRYQKKFGMAAAVAGIPALLGCAIVEVAEADLADAIAKVDNAVAGDAPGPVEDAAPAAAEKPVEKAATKDDVMAAMLRYAKKFDGQNTDMNAMPNTMADAPKIFGLLFGESVVKLSQVPADGYARTVAAFDEAIAKNPFKR